MFHKGWNSHKIGMGIDKEFQSAYRSEAVRGSIEHQEPSKFLTFHFMTLRINFDQIIPTVRYIIPGFGWNGRIINVLQSYKSQLSDIAEPRLELFFNFTMFLFKPIEILCFNFLIEI